MGGLGGLDEGLLLLDLGLEEEGVLLLLLLLLGLDEEGLFLLLLVGEGFLLLLLGLEEEELLMELLLLLVLSLLLVLQGVGGGAWRGRLDGRS